MEGVFPVDTIINGKLTIDYYQYTLVRKFIFGTPPWRCPIMKTQGTIPPFRRSENENLGCFFREIAIAIGLNIDEIYNAIGSLNPEIILINSHNLSLLFPSFIQISSILAKNPRCCCLHFQNIPS